jgi:hypothetical protein
MHECLYNYLEIEEIGYGIHALVKEDGEIERKWWFIWNSKKNAWESINSPNWSKGFSNWSIG